MSEKFWLENPAALFSSFDIVPQESMTQNQKLNALTRLSILITAGMYGCCFKYAPWFFIGSIVIIIILKYAFNSQSFSQKSKSGCKSCSTKDILDDYEKEFEKKMIHNSTRRAEKDMEFIQHSYDEVLGETPVDAIYPSCSNTVFIGNVEETKRTLPRRHRHHTDIHNNSYAKNASADSLAPMLGGYPRGFEKEYVRSTDVMVPNNLSPSDHEYLSHNNVNHSRYVYDSIMDDEGEARCAIDTRYQSMLRDRGRLTRY